MITNSVRMACATRSATRCVAFSLRNNFMINVRSKVVELLNQRNIKVTSVDFVHFTWLIKDPDLEIEEDDDDDEDEEDAKDEEEVGYDSIPPIQPVEDGIRCYTNPTIWICVL